MVAPAANGELGMVNSETPSPPAWIPASAGMTGRAELASMVYATFPESPYMAEHVVWAESMGDQFLDDDNGNGQADWIDYVYGGRWSATEDCGLMQLHWPVHDEKFYDRGWTAADCFDPVKNLAIAREVFDGQGPGAWTTY